jgi:hypothetical protein
VIALPRERVRPVELREPTERGAGIFFGDVGEALRGVRPVRLGGGRRTSR